MVEKKKSSGGSEFWQIFFPTILGGVLLLVLGIWLGITGSSGSLSRFAEISTVLLVIPVYLIALLFALMLVGMIYLVGKLLQVIPSATSWVLGILDKIRDGTISGTRTLARLVIEPAAFLAGFQRKRYRQHSEIKLND